MARMIPKRTLEEIRFRNDIAEVIGSYIHLQRAGANFKCACPFHKEKTPSFIVNTQRQIYHCFGCGAGGDVFGFIQQYEGVDFVTAAKLLAQRGGIVVDLEEGDDRRTSEKELLYKIHEEIAHFYERCLLQVPSAETARRYLADRDLTGEVISEFLIGFAPNRWDAALRWGIKHKFGAEALEKAGLLLRSQKAGSGGRHYDRFRNRVMFPIRDAQNRVIGFSGRTLEDDPRAAKYVNSPETTIFHKSRVLYALEKARRHIVAGDPREAILCEGQIDVIRCHQAGFNTAIASQGTAFTEDHARVLSRYADGVVIVFDPDRAGEDAAIKTAALFIESGLAVRVAALPPNEDPDSFIRKRGADAFQSVLDEAVSAVSHHINVLASRGDIKTEIGAMQSAKAVLATVQRSPNAVQRAKLLQEAAEKLNIPASALQDELKRMSRPVRHPTVSGPASSQEPSRSQHPAEEVQLCEHMAHIIDYPAIAELVETYLPLELLTDPACRGLAAAFLEAGRSGREVQDVLRESADRDDELTRLSAAVLLAPDRMAWSELRMEDAVKSLILRLWQRRLEAKRDALQRRKALPEEADNAALIAESNQVSTDLKALRTWEDGEAIIRFNLPEPGVETAPMADVPAPKNTDSALDGVSQG